jgi:hypothetical protein
VGVNTSNNNDIDFADEVAEQLDMLEESLNNVEIQCDETLSKLDSSANIINSKIQQLNNRLTPLLSCRPNGL